MRNEEDHEEYTVEKQGAEHDNDNDQGALLDSEDQDEDDQ
jgi:hypothetical protein